MTTTSEQIDLWRAAKSEHQNLEFKEAKTQFDNKKLYKYCATIDAGLIKLDPNAPASRKYARYLPIWA